MNVKRNVFLIIIFVRLISIWLIKHFLKLKTKWFEIINLILFCLFILVIEIQFIERSWKENLFKEPKVRLGNRTYSQSELQDYRKANTQRYNNKVRYSSQNSKYTDFYHSLQWRKLRKQVLLRDNHLCQHCLNKGIVNDKDLIVHHKVCLLYTSPSPRD